MTEESKRGRKSKKQSADLLEIVGKISPVKVSTPEDELSRVIDEQIKLMSKQYKINLLKKMNKELEKDIRDLDKVISETLESERESIRIGGDGGVDVNLTVARELAKLPEEERNKVIEAYTLLRAADRQASNPNMLLPLLIAYSRENRGSTVNDMIEWAKLQQDAIKTGIEVATSKGKPSGEADQMVKVWTTIFDKMVELEKESRKKEMEIISNRLKEIADKVGGGILDTILLNQDVRNALKEIGFFQKPQTGSDPRLHVELEKMRMQHEKELEKMRMDFQIQLAKLRTEQQKVAAMLQGLRSIGAAAFDAFMEASEPSQGTEQASQPQGGDVASANCPSCNGEIFFPANASRVTCPHCGSSLVVKQSEE